MKDLFLSSIDFAHSVSSRAAMLYGNIFRQKTTMLISTTNAGEKDAEIIDIAGGLTVPAVYFTTKSRMSKHVYPLCFKENLYFSEPEFSKDSDEKEDYADLIINTIKKIHEAGYFSVFVIDSVTRIAALSFGRNASATYVMKRLMSLQMKLGVSMIVIARDASKPVTRALKAMADTTMDLFPDEDAENRKTARPKKEKTDVKAQDQDQDKETPSPSEPLFVPAAEFVKTDSCPPDSQNGKSIVAPHDERSRLRYDTASCI